jgi:hypothetical protein
MAGRSCQQSPIGYGELRLRDLAAHYLELVTQHQQLDVFHLRAAAATNEGVEQIPQGRGEGTRRPCRRSSQASR